MDWQSRLEARYIKLQQKYAKKPDHRLQKQLEEMEVEYFVRCRESLPKKLMAFLADIETKS